MKTTTSPRLYVLGSIFLSAYFVNRCHFGEAGFINKFFESSTANYAYSQLPNTTKSDGVMTSHSKQNVSVATHLRTTGIFNHRTREGNTVYYHKSTEASELFTTSNASVITSPTESDSTKKSDLTTYGSKRASGYEVTGQQEQTATTEYIRQDSIELNSNGGNTYSSGLTTTITPTVTNKSNLMEAETISIETVSENMITMPTAQTDVPSKYCIWPEISGILSNYVNPGICGIGIFCNVVSLIVLGDKEMSDSPYIYLTALAISDMGVLIMVFIYDIFNVMSTDYAAVAFGTYVFYPLVNIFMFASIWVTCALTLERIVYIKRPLLARSICTRKRAKRFISCIFIFDIIFNIPRFFFYRPLCKNVECSDVMTKFMHFEGLNYISWTYIAIVNSLPLIISIMSNLYMTRLVHVSSAERQGMQPHLSSQEGANHNQRDHTNKLTLTLISIVFVFIICTFPSAFSELEVSHVLFGGNMTVSEYHETDFYVILLKVTNSLALLNSSLNFFLYCVFSDKFRNVLRRKMMSVLCKK